MKRRALDNQVYAALAFKDSNRLSKPSTLVWLAKKARTDLLLPVTTVIAAVEVLRRLIYKVKDNEDEMGFITAA